MDAGLVSLKLSEIPRYGPTLGKFISDVGNFTPIGSPPISTMNNVAAVVAPVALTSSSPVAFPCASAVALLSNHLNGGHGSGHDAVHPFFPASVLHIAP